jgi:hypothetical protein
MRETESAPKRAWKDTVSWLLNSLIAWVVVALVGGGMSGLFIPSDSTLISRIGFGILGATITVILIISVTYLIHLIIVPYRQRNDAIRQRDEIHDQIAELQNSYAGALSFDEISILPASMKGFISLKLSNSTDFPIQLKVDETQTYMEVDGKRLPQRARPPDVGGIIPKLRTIDFVLGYNIQEIIQATKIILHYELEYGRPGNFMYRQIRDLNLSLNQIGNQVLITYTHNICKDIPT